MRRHKLEAAAAAAAAAHPQPAGDVRAAVRRGPLGQALIWEVALVNAMAALQDHRRQRQMG